jgi:hypothetical protein
MSDDWTIRDAEAYEVEAKKLEDDGYLREPSRWYQYKFTKGHEVVVLVRDLGKLNWHPKVLEQ